MLFDAWMPIRYDLHGIMLKNPGLMLKNAGNDTVMVNGGGHVCDVFDFGQARARELFIETCVNATQSGYVDGCFVDRAVDGTPTDGPDDNTPSGKKYNLTNATAWAYFEGQSKSIILGFTENLLENTGGVPRPPSLLSRGGSLLPSIRADVRAILMTSSHSEGHIKMLTDLQTAVGEGPVIANHAYVNQFIGFHRESARVPYPNKQTNKQARELMRVGAFHQCSLGVAACYFYLC